MAPNQSRPRDPNAKRIKALADSWKAPPSAWPAARFQAEFDALLATAAGPATEWRLGSGANDYLRKNPDAVRVPPDLILHLLDSPLVDGRLVGLKLLIRLSTDEDLIQAEIGKALQSRSEIVRLGGVCETTNALDRGVLKTPTHLLEVAARMERCRFRVAGYADFARHTLLRLRELSTT